MALTGKAGTSYRLAVIRIARRLRPGVPSTAVRRYRLTIPSVEALRPAEPISSSETALLRALDKTFRHQVYADRIMTHKGFTFDPLGFGVRRRTKLFHHTLREQLKREMDA